MSKYVMPNGFLSEEGKLALQGISSELMRLFLSVNVQEMSEQETRSFGSCLSAVVKDVVSYAVLRAKERAKL